MKEMISTSELLKTLENRREMAKGVMGDLGGAVSGIMKIIEAMASDDMVPEQPSEEQSMDSVLEYLETAYTGARAINDEESMVRIARAIEAYNLDAEKDCVISTQPIED